MTLSEMSSFITAKVGQVDSASVAMCKDFIRRRYQMVYDSFLWRDSQLTATATTTANSSEVAMPASMDRVVAIRAGTTFLDPVDSASIIASDPTAFERTGLPLYYEEYTDPAASNAKKIRLFPVPNAAISLRIIGKRVMPPLSGDSDSPIIRNIDNCLLAFAQADMLQKIRQYAKAKELIAEAGALLENAKKIETDQAARPRVSKNLTVAGNSLAEMTDSVCARCGIWTIDNQILAREFLRRNYQLIYDSRLWTESTVIASVSTSSGELVLPPYFDRVVSLRADASLAGLTPSEPSLYFAVAPGVFEQTGMPLSFSYLAPVAVAVLPPVKERLSIVSANTADKSNVFVMGESDGVEISETVVLNGTTHVQTANSYDTPLTLAKGVTLGDVTVTGYTSDAELVRILANERERKHIRLWLQPTTTDTLNCLVLGKRRIKPFVQDEDTPLLSQIGSALIWATAGDMFAKLGNDKAAADARSQADTALKTLISLETEQGAYVRRVVPCAEPQYSYANDDAWYLAK